MTNNKISIIHFTYKGLNYIQMLLMSKAATLIFKMKLKLNKVTFGNGIHCYNAIPLLQISKNATKVQFGENFTLNAYTDHSWNSNNKIIVKSNAILIIGDNSGINGCMINCSKKIMIGNNVKIGGGTRISDTNHHSLDYQKRRTKEDSRC